MIKGVIFDMDGVLSDTQKLHSLTESELLCRFGINITPEEITRKYSGVKTKEFLGELLSRQKKPYDLESLMAENWEKMKEYASQGVEPIDGAVELVAMLHEERVQIAVVSSSNLDYVKTVLCKLGIRDYFTAVVSGDMVRKGKPDPEGFLLAAGMINVPPEDCLVIEDGISGMQAALNANMKCIGLVADANRAYPTQHLVSSLKAITPEYLMSL